MNRVTAQQPLVHRARRRRRRGGMASIEVVASAAVMLPVAGALFFLGLRMTATVYQAIGALVGWPFL